MGRGAYKVLVGKREDKRLLGRPRRRLNDNIKMDIQKVIWWAWIRFIWLRLETSDRLL
jgi:hypothetical protein